MEFLASEHFKAEQGDNYLVEEGLAIGDQKIKFAVSFLPRPNYYRGQ